MDDDARVDSRSFAVSASSLLWLPVSPWCLALILMDRPCNPKEVGVSVGAEQRTGVCGGCDIVDGRSRHDYSQQGNKARRGLSCNCLSMFSRACRSPFFPARWIVLLVRQRLMRPRSYFGFMVLLAALAD